MKKNVIRPRGNTKKKNKGNMRKMPPLPGVPAFVWPRVWAGRWGTFAWIGVGPGSCGWECNGLWSADCWVGGGLRPLLDSAVAEGMEVTTLSRLSRQLRRQSCLSRPFLSKKTRGLTNSATAHDGNLANQPLKFQITNVTTKCYQGGFFF